MGTVTACENELPGRVSASLPRELGDVRDPELRLALIPAESRALLLGARLLGKTVPGLFGTVLRYRREVSSVARWSRPYAEPRGMLLVRVHLPPLELAEAHLTAARFGIRAETYLVARAFELMRERMLAEPVLWAFVGVPAAELPSWSLVAAATENHA